SQNERKPHHIDAPTSRTPTPTSFTQLQAQSSLSSPPQSAGIMLGSEPEPVPKLPPRWLSEAIHATQTSYPRDRFEAILRGPNWRIKCADCPGKLYVPGPGETLSNYEVHLRNRQHRQRVNNRSSRTKPA
ncbi:hypothetical protein BD779DRAFT_1507704, partial [Infundibulicybe gibba]